MSPPRRGTGSALGEWLEHAMSRWAGLIANCGHRTKEIQTHRSQMNGPRNSARHVISSGLNGGVLSCYRLSWSSEAVSPGDSLLHSCISCISFPRPFRRPDARVWDLYHCVVALGSQWALLLFLYLDFFFREMA